MKTKTFFLTIGTACLISNAVNATECESRTCPTGVTISTIGSTEHCASGHAGGGCYYITGRAEVVRAYGCGTCESGYVRKDLSNHTGGSCTISFLSECVFACAETDWSTTFISANNALYQSRTVCINNVSTTQYRCVSGYYDVMGSGVATKYGNTASGYVYCAKCPSYTVNGANVSATSTPGSTKKMSACYIKAGTTGTDDTGTFTITSDCGYN